MRVFHRTDEADAILRDGFRDTVGRYLTSETWRGVWVSDAPLDANESAEGCVLFSLDIPEALFAAHEWVEEGKGYREALIPAGVLNEYRATMTTEYRLDFPLYGSGPLGDVPPLIDE